MEKKVFAITYCKKTFLVDVDELSVKRLVPSGDGNGFIPEGGDLIFASDITWADCEFSRLEGIHVTQVKEQDCLHEEDLTDREKALLAILNLVERKVETDRLAELD